MNAEDAPAGTDLDAAINEEVFGFETLRCDGDIIGIRDPKSDDAVTDIILPAYSTEQCSIAKILEHLRKKYWPEIGVHFDAEKDEWCCHWGMDQYFVSCYAPTVALAVCRGALRIVREEREEEKKRAVKKDRTKSV